MKYPIKKKSELMTDVQHITLEIYKEFKNVCQKNKLFYIGSDGTLLGAIREGGFIPHDDDMDVTMPIEDAEKLIKVWEEQKKNKHYKITWFRNYHCIKIYDDRTTHIEFANISHFDTHEGIFFDIFPFIGLPSEKLRRDIFINEVKQQRQISSKAYFDRSNKYENEIRKLHKMYFEYPVEKSKYCVELDVFHGVYNKDDWFNTIDIDFEDTSIPIPVNHTVRLIAQYGQNYHKRLGKDEQVSQHKIAALIDLKKPFKFYSDNLKNFNTDFLLEIEKLTHIYYSTHGYSSRKQGELYKLEQSVLEKDMIIESLKKELNSFRSVNKSTKLLFKNIKRSLATRFEKL